jgi:dTDP-4-dehydrorhamnose 3,5-epimerase
MKVINTSIPDLLIIEPEVYGDERGYFLESFQCERYTELVTKHQFVQDNFSRSCKGVLRGLHFQKTKPQGKLVSVLEGEVLDVAVDLRPNSRYFGQYEAVQLTAEKHNQLFVPPGFAHGFLVMSDFATFHYKCTDFYDPNDEAGIMWNDNDLDINWGSDNPLVSQKDQMQLSFIEFKKLIGK